MCSRLGVTLFVFLFLPFLFADQPSNWNDFSQEKTKFLSADKAFGVDSYFENGFAEIRWQIADGYYLYKDKIFLRKLDSPDRKLEFGLPPGELFNDPEFGEVEIYRNTLILKSPIKDWFDSFEEASLIVGYQGCADAGLCYPPTTEIVSLGSFQKSPAVLSPPDSSTVLSLAPHLLVLSFLGFGLLLSMTPCVFPMMPILSGILVGRHSKVNSPRAFYISSVYVFSMAATYAILGLLVAILGRELQVVLHHPVSILFMAGLFLVLGLSMLGFYNLDIPRPIRERLNRIANSRTPNSILGVASMGCLSALIATPCITPPLAAVLTYVADSGSPARGALALFSLGLGMGIPLIVFGTSLGFFLPRSGRWMDGLKKIVGIILIGFGIWFAGRILPDLIINLVWVFVVVLIVTHLTFGLLKRRYFLESVSTRKVIYTSIFFFALGSSAFFGCLDGFYRSGGLEWYAGSKTIQYTSVDNLADFDSQLLISVESERPILLEFYADWCVECKRMESKTFDDDRVKALLENFIFLRVDITQNTEDHRAMLEYFNLFGPPAILFFSSRNTNEISREIGFIDAERFSRKLKFVLSENG